MVKFLISELINEGYRLGDIIVVRGERYVIIEPPPYSRDYGIFWYVIKLVPPAKRNTDLEKKTEQYLSELGFKEHEDYEKQYSGISTQLTISQIFMKISANRMQ